MGYFIKLDQVFTPPEIDMEYICNIGKGCFKFLECFYELNYSSGEFYDDYYISSSIIVLTLSEDEDYAKQDLLKSIKCLSFVLQTSFHLLLNQLESIQHVDVPKPIRQSVSNLDADILAKIKKFEVMFLKLPNAYMLIEFIDYYCSGLHFEATNKSLHVSYLEYFKVVEILANKEFRSNTIAQDETTKLIKMLLNKKAQLSASKIETYANGINKTINSMLSTDTYYKIGYYLSSNKIKYDADNLALLVKTRNDLAHGNIKALDDKNLLCDIKNLSYQIIFSYVKNHIKTKERHS